MLIDLGILVARGGFIESPTAVDIVVYYEIAHFFFPCNEKHDRTRFVLLFMTTSSVCK